MFYPVDRMDQTQKICNVIRNIQDGHAVLSFQCVSSFLSKKIVGTIVPVSERTIDQFSPLFMGKALFVIKKLTCKFI